MPEQKPLKFFDTKAKRVFRTSKYQIIKSKGKLWAKTQSPYSDNTYWTIYKG